MRLACSNIAWAPGQDAEAAAALREGGATGVELAPTTRWPDPLLATPAERRALRDHWSALGLPIVALQSLLFGRPDLQLFDPATRGELLDRLVGLMELGRDLGAGVLVLGSPRNRARGRLPPDEALALAVPFFREVGTAGERLGLSLCIEPNPPEYGCDFVTTAAEGRALVQAVGSPGFGLHLDAAAMHLAGDDAGTEVGASRQELRHVHLSAPQLGPVGPASPVDAPALVAALRAIGYAGTLSIEMRAAPTGAASLRRVREALAFAAACLGAARSRPPRDGESSP